MTEVTAKMEEMTLQIQNKNARQYYSIPSTTRQSISHWNWESCCLTAGSCRLSNLLPPFFTYGKTENNYSYSFSKFSFIFALFVNTTGAISGKTLRLYFLTHTLGGVLQFQLHIQWQRGSNTLSQLPDFKDHIPVQ